MKNIELKKVEHKHKTGQPCPNFEPTIKEDCLLRFEGETIGFFIQHVEGKLRDYLNIANNEFRSDNVPKMMLSRGTKKLQAKKGLKLVQQYSTIIGSVPPKPHMMRNYSTISSVHQNKKAQTFIKAMLLACAEAENHIEQWMPEQYQSQLNLIQNGVSEQWRFGNLFTSSISNFNVSAPFHQDRANIPNTVNVILYITNIETEIKNKIKERMK